MKGKVFGRGFGRFSYESRRVKEPKYLRKSFEVDNSEDGELRYEGEEFSTQLENLISNGSNSPLEEKEEEEEKTKEKIEAKDPSMYVESGTEMEKKDSDFMDQIDTEKMMGKQKPTKQLRL